MKSASLLGIAVASLLVLAGFAAAQSGSGGPGPGGSSGAPPSGGDRPCANESTEQGRQECLKRYCESTKDPRCPNQSNGTKPPQNGTGKPPMDGNGSKLPAACDTKGNPEFCREMFCQNHPEAQFCRGEGNKTVRDALREALKDGKRRSKVGAEIALTRGEGDKGVQVLSYDNVTVKVRGTDRVARPGNPINITLSSNLTEGRTFAFTLNRSLLPSDDPDRLVLRYFDVHADGNTEVKFQRADSLADVLDPTNDAGQPEYWVVKDSNGLQVLVSVPHWSTHVVTLGGLDAIVPPSALVGLFAGVLASGIAAVALFVPRRRQP
jgi:hypothetical protein